MIRALSTLLATMLLAGSALATPRLLVVSRDEKALKSYDPATYELQFTVKLPGDPHEVVASSDGLFAYSSDFEGRNNTVSIIDLTEGKRIDSVKMDPYFKPHGLALTKDGTKLYATCEASRVVAQLDIPTRKVGPPFRISVESAHMLALSPDEKWLFVTSQWDNNVTIIDLEKGEIRKTIATGKGAEGVAFTPDGKEAWVVNRTWQTLAIIDMATLKKLQTMSCEHNPMRVVVTPDGATVIVTSALSDEVALVDRAKREVVGRIKTGDFPVGMALSKDGSMLYVTNLNGGDVAVVDLPNRKVVHRLAVGGQPEGITLVE